MQIYIYRRQIVVKNGNFTFLLTSSGQAMAISHFYWHLVVKNGNFLHFYWDLVIKNGQSDMAWHLVQCIVTLRHLVSQEWQFPPPHSTLSEDRVISSLFNVVIETQGQIYLPWVNSSKGQSDLFTIQCCHWNSMADIPPCSTVAEDRVISSLFNVVIDTQRQIYPPVNTIRGQSDLFTVQCCHWHSKADIPPWSTLSEDRVISSLFNVVIETQRQIYPPFNTIRGQSDLFTVQCCHWHSKADIPPNPPVNPIRGQSDLFTVQCCHWDSKADIPPIQHYQRTEWSLHCSMLSLTLKGRYTAPGNSIRGQIDLFTVQCCHWDSKGDIPPQSTLAEDSVISSLFNVVIETQRQIYRPSQHYQRTEWSLQCSMLSLTLKGRYTHLVNPIRGQSDLFTVQCCHWHSKADIPPRSTVAEDRVISSLFNVVIETQRHIYSPHLSSSKSV